MIRKLTMLTAILLAIGGALFAPTADAQGAPTCQLFFGDLMLEIPLDTDTDLAFAQPAGDSAELRPMDDYYLHYYDCADALAYPGPFTNMPTVPLSPYAAAVSITAAPQPVAVTAAAATPALALSGSETAVLAYLGTGLVAFGAFALGIRRGTASE